ncbi:hypothetical protein D9M72_565990 [compost metagenome]
MPVHRRRLVEPVDETRGVRRTLAHAQDRRHAAVLSLAQTVGHHLRRHAIPADLRFGEACRQDLRIRRGPGAGRHAGAERKGTSQSSGALKKSAATDDGHFGNLGCCSGCCRF